MFERLVIPSLSAVSRKEAPVLFAPPCYSLRGVHAISPRALLSLQGSELVRGLYFSTIVILS